MADRLRIFATSSVAATAAEANAMGVPPGALIEADLSRLRWLAEGAMPTLTVRETALLAHVLDGVEGHRVLTGDNSLPSGATIAAMLTEWADNAVDDDMIVAEELTRRVLTWSPLTVISLLMGMRR